MAQEQKEAGDPDGDSAAESRKNESVSPANPRDLQKYDIERIGQRGIGRAFNIYSARKERELGESIAATINRNSKIVQDEFVNAYIDKLAQRIVRNSDADMPFTVRVIDDATNARAYGIPGGFLYVDSALILASDGEAELASIMAHEIAHVAARHATRALTRKRIYSVAGSMALFAGPAGMGLANGGGVAGPLSLKKFSRNAEYEADLLAMEYIYSAGYDPQALLGALEKLNALEVQKTAAFSKVPGYHMATHLPFHHAVARGFSDYPLIEERIGRLQSEIPAFLPSRNDYILDTDEFQEVRARLLASQVPVLHHRAPGGDDSKGPVLHRIPEGSEEAASHYGLAFLP